MSGAAVRVQAGIAARRAGLDAECGRAYGKFRKAKWPSSGLALRDGRVLLDYADVLVPVANDHRGQILRRADMLGRAPKHGKTSLFLLKPFRECQRKSLAVSLQVAY